jgi:hypothetical protein
MKNKRVILPQRRPMGHRQQSDIEFCGIFHHHTLNVGWDQGSRLVQNGVLQLSQYFNQLLKDDMFYPRLVIE